MCHQIESTLDTPHGHTNKCDELAAVVSDSHQLSSLTEIQLSDLAGEAWILFPERFGPGLYRRILEACASAGFAPRVVQEATQMETIVGLVSGGIGIPLVPRVLASQGRVGAAFCRLVGPGSPVTYELAVAFRERSPILDAFVASAVLAEDPSRPI